jgi:N-acetylated-alpha-linked acidic dipeptidase
MWQEVYADPGFRKHVCLTFFHSLFADLTCDQVAVAQNLGLITLRLADSIILPLNTTQYALELDSYVDT